jgi:fructuronate reductase
VICEPFCQWVIADSLPQPRPAWEKFGVTFVRDVAPFEKMKLRLLNGAHSTMAYLGYLGGYEYIHQVIADPDYLGFVRAMLREEVVPTLRMPADIDLDAYCASLITRFRNPALHHRTWQIAMDGSAKIPQRLLDTLRDRMAGKKPTSRLTLAVAGWLRYVTGIDERGQAIEVSDPFAARLRTLADRHAGDVPGYARAILGIREVFGDDLPAHASFCSGLIEALQTLYRAGARQAVRELSR